MLQSYFKDMLKRIFDISIILIGIAVVILLIIILWFVLTLPLWICNDNFWDFDDPIYLVCYPILGAFIWIILGIFVFICFCVIYYIFKGK